MRIQFRPLAAVADVFVGLPTRTGRAISGAPTMKVLSVRSLTDNGIDAEALIRADVHGEIQEKYLAQAGDVLIPARSTSLKAGVVPRELTGTPINATLVGIRCSPELDPRFLCAYLRHPDGHAAIAEHTQSGTAQLNITVKGLSQLPVPVPPWEAQGKLVAMLQAADDAYQAATDAANRRRRLAMDIIFSKITGDVSL